MPMLIGERIRAIRVAKNLSQGDIENRSGLLRHYISRVENGHTTPAVETLEKLARALEVPLYQLFYENERPRELPRLPKRMTTGKIGFGNSGKEAHYLKKLRSALSRMSECDRLLLFAMAQKMAGR